MRPTAKLMPPFVIGRISSFKRRGKAIPAKAARVARIALKMNNPPEALHFLPIQCAMKSRMNDLP
jgi:hypothetical protein